jgi:hypothetical protein
MLPSQQEDAALHRGDHPVGYLARGADEIGSSFRPGARPASGENSRIYLQNFGINLLKIRIKLPKNALFIAWFKSG